MEWRGVCCRVRDGRGVELTGLSGLLWKLGKGVCGEPGGNEGCTGLVWKSKRRFRNHHIAGESHPTGLDSESGSHQFIPRPHTLAKNLVPFPDRALIHNSLFSFSQEMSCEGGPVVGRPLEPHILFIRALHGIVDLDAARPASRILVARPVA